MTTAAPSTALATIQPAFTDAERLALAGYGGLTREACALDPPVHDLVPGPVPGPVRRPPLRYRVLRPRPGGQGTGPGDRHPAPVHQRRVLQVRRRGGTDRPLTATHVRRPRVDYESHAVALDRNELGALLVAAGLGLPAEHALISLLALNGLGVSEATGADIEHLGLERGHRTLTITRKGGKVVTIPLAPRTARAIDLAVGERTGGPVFLTTDGRRLDRHGAGRIVRKTVRRARMGKTVTPRTLRHAFITAALDAGVPLRDVQEAASHADPRTTIRYDRARGSLDRHATYIIAAYAAGAGPAGSQPAGPPRVPDPPDPRRPKCAAAGGSSARRRSRDPARPPRRGRTPSPGGPASQDRGSLAAIQRYAAAVQRHAAPHQTDRAQSHRKPGARKPARTPPPGHAQGQAAPPVIDGAVDDPHSGMFCAKSRPENKHIKVARNR